MTGFKAPAGTYSWLGDKFAEAQANAATGEDTASLLHATGNGRKSLVIQVVV
jgi:hypothetical protein